MDVSGSLPLILDLPVLPLRSFVLFPYAALPLTLTRPSVIAAAKAAGDGQLVAVVTQRDREQEEPTCRDSIESAPPPSSEWPRPGTASR